MALGSSVCEDTMVDFSNVTAGDKYQRLLNISARIRTFNRKYSLVWVEESCLQIQSQHQHSLG